jgi:hypothetical protein
MSANDPFKILCYFSMCRLMVKNFIFNIYASKELSNYTYSKDGDEVVTKLH